MKVSITHVCGDISRYFWHKLVKLQRKMFSFCVQSPVQQKLTAILSPIDRKIASRQNSGKNNFFYRDRIGVLISILGVLVGVFDVLAGIFLIQSSPFFVPCWKKYATLKKVRQRRWWRCWLISSMLQLSHNCAKLRFKWYWFKNMN